MTVRIAVLEAVRPDATQLSGSERAHLALLVGPRRDEWIRGRVALRQVLGTTDASVLVGADGAPHVVGGAACSVSLSHDGTWIAIAVGDAKSRVGIDVCRRMHADRIAELLRRLAVQTECDAVTTWVALETTLKLRGRSIEGLRSSSLAVRRDERCARVSGLGAEVAITIRSDPSHVVGWAREVA